MPIVPTVVDENEETYNDVEETEEQLSHLFLQHNSAKEIVYIDLPYRDEVLHIAVNTPQLLEVPSRLYPRILGLLKAKLQRRALMILEECEGDPNELSQRQLDFTRFRTQVLKQVYALIQTQHADASQGTMKQTNGFEYRFEQHNGSVFDDSVLPMVSETPEVEGDVWRKEEEDEFDRKRRRMNEVYFESLSHHRREVEEEEEKEEGNCGLYLHLKELVRNQDPSIHVYENRVDVLKLEEGEEEVKQLIEKMVKESEEGVVVSGEDVVGGEEKVVSEEEKVVVGGEEKGMMEEKVVAEEEKKKEELMRQKEENESVKEQEKVVGGEEKEVNEEKTSHQKEKEVNEETSHQETRRNEESDSLESVALSGSDHDASLQHSTKESSPIENTPPNPPPEPTVQLLNDDATIDGDLLFEFLDNGQLLVSREDSKMGDPTPTPHQESPPSFLPDVEHTSLLLQASPQELQQHKQTLLQQYKHFSSQNAFVSEDVILDIVEILRVFGIPYVFAPGEAEAQCAFLEMMGLVDGVISNDSDVFAFGGKSLYRNFFVDNRYVEAYLSDDLETEVGLNRDRIILYAMLEGCDYSEVCSVGIRLSL